MHVGVAKDDGGAMQRVAMFEQAVQLITEHGRGQVGASGVVPSRSQPRLGEKHQLCVVGNEGVIFCSFRGALDRKTIEQSN